MRALLPVRAGQMGTGRQEASAYLFVICFHNGQDTFVGLHLESKRDHTGSASGDGASCSIFEVVTKGSVDVLVKVDVGVHATGCHVRSIGVDHLLC